MAARRGKKTATRSRRPPDHVVTVKDLKANNPSLVSLITERLKPYATLATTILVLGGLLTGSVAIYKASGARWFVFDDELKVQIEVAKTHTNTKVEEVKSLVNSTKSELLTETGKAKDELGRSLTTLTKNLANSELSRLEDLRLSLFSQIQTQEATVRQIEAALRDKPNDDLLLGRKKEIDRWVKVLEERQKDVNEKIRKARE
jgi:hypothetical protein